MERQFNISDNKLIDDIVNEKVYHSYVNYIYCLLAIETLRNLEKDVITDNISWQYAHYYNYPWKHDCKSIKRFKEVFPEKLLTFVVNKCFNVCQSLSLYFQNHLQKVFDPNIAYDYNKYRPIAISANMMKNIQDIINRQKSINNTRAISVFGLDNEKLFEPLSEVSKTVQTLDMLVRTNWSHYHAVTTDNHFDGEYLTKDMVKTLLLPIKFLDNYKDKINLNNFERSVFLVRYTANILSILYHLVTSNEFHKNDDNLNTLYNEYIIDNRRYKYRHIGRWDNIVEKALMYAKHYTDGTCAFCLGMPILSEPILTDCNKLPYMMKNTLPEQYTVARHILYHNYLYDKQNKECNIESVVDVAS